MTEEVIHIHKTENPAYQSSLEIGTPGKGGNLKVYFNPKNPEEAEQLLTNAYELLKKARQLMEQ